MDIYEIRQTLLGEYANKRIQEEARAVRAMEKANTSPEFVRLQKLEKVQIFDLGKLKAEGKNTKKLEAELKTTRQAKKLELQKLGLEESDLKPGYTCQNCKDTGYVGTVMCECLKRKINAEIIAQSGFGVTDNISFDDFKTDFSNEKISKEYEKNKKFLMDWCKKYPNTRSKILVLLGKTGVGKTFAVKCTANEMITKGVSVCFVSAFEMNNLFLKYHSTFDASKNSVLMPLTKSDVLFIDDLGTEPIINNVTINYLYLILTERERFGKPVFITTNLSPKQLEERYGERISSRLFNKDTAKTFLFSGDDLRLKINKNT